MRSREFSDPGSLYADLCRAEISTSKEGGWKANLPPFCTRVEH